MNLAADTLFVLCSFSVRMHFISKAIIYGRAGIHLFPDDVRLHEIYAHALLLDGRAEEASHILSKVQEPTRNTAYLNARISLQDTNNELSAQDQLRLYLQMEQKT